MWAQSVTALWSEEPVAERSLQQGKVQNLRCATRQLNDTCVPQGRSVQLLETNWAATTRRGYAPGRLLREGCLLPAVGGACAKLSNALYDVALKVV
jgi:vancomycin resistance protein YoaR